MTTWDTNSEYFSGQGVVLVGTRNALTGKGDKFLPVGNVSALKLGLAATTSEHKESQTGVRGIDKRLTTELKSSISMTMESWTPANLALAMRGTSTALAGGTVTGEDLVFTGGFISPLAHIKVSAVAVKKGATVLVKYVEGTATAVDGEWDYKLNTEAGSIQWAETPKTAALVDMDAIDVDYTYAAQSVADALNAAPGEVYLRFEGLNTADENKPVVIDVFRMQTDPLKELSLISDTIGEFVLEGSVLFDAIQTGSKYFRVTKTA